MPTNSREYQRNWYAEKRKNDPAYAERRRQKRLANYDTIREQEKASRERNMDRHRADSRERMRQARAEKPDHIRAVAKRCRLKKKYGLTEAQWDAMFTSQGNACAICRTPQSETGKWHTDHCHKSGTVRGILCNHCNLMLGHSRDNPDTLLAAAAYLKQ